MTSTIRVDRICEFCGATFTARTTVTRFCGDDCAKRAYKLRQREAKIEKSNRSTNQRIHLNLKEIDSKPFLNLTEAGRLLGVSRRTLYRLIADNNLPHFKIGRRTLISRVELDHFITSNGNK